MQAFILIVFITLTFQMLKCQGYRVRMLVDDIENRSVFCTPNNLCSGKAHTMCLPEVKAPYDFSLCPSYIRFQPLRISKSQVVYSHNGIRDRFAKKYNISNMNMLHYDVDLEEMARKFVRICKIYEDDDCKFLLNSDYPIGQNRKVFYKLPKANFIKIVIRDWYLEDNGIVNREDLKNINLSKVMNLTQVIWPKTQFVGCGAGIFGVNFFAVCNYWPPVNLSIDPFKYGRKCSRCPPARRSCSIIFKNLCGLDEFNDRLKGANIKIEKMLIIILLILNFFMILN